MSDLKIEDKTICFRSPFGKVELIRSGFARLKVPELGIDISGLPDSLSVRVLNDVI